MMAAKKTASDWTNLVARPDAAAPTPQKQHTAKKTTPKKKATKKATAKRTPPARTETPTKRERLAVLPPAPPAVAKSYRMPQDVLELLDYAVSEAAHDGIRLTATSALVEAVRAHYGHLKELYKGDPEQ